MPNPTLLILLFYTQREIMTNQRLLTFTRHTQILSTSYEHTKNSAMLILAARWFDLDVERLSVIIRRVRLVSLRSSETEFCPGDAAVHVFDVLTLRLKMICGVVRARNKYLANTKSWQSLYISFWFYPPNFPEQNVLFSFWVLLPDPLFHRRSERAGGG